jgi:hypothetical protein
METSGGSKFRQNHVEVVREKNTVQWNRREERENGIRCVKQNGQIRIKKTKRKKNKRKRQHNKESRGKKMNRR